MHLPVGCSRTPVGKRHQGLVRSCTGAYSAFRCLAFGSGPAGQEAESPGRQSPRGLESNTRLRVRCSTAPTCPADSELRSACAESVGIEPTTPLPPTRSDYTTPVNTTFGIPLCARRRAYTRCMSRSVLDYTQMLESLGFTISRPGVWVFDATHPSLDGRLWIRADESFDDRVSVLHAPVIECGFHGPARY
jgi:hypothetical protein